MSDTNGGLRIVTTQASGWCDPETGVCHFDTTDTTDAGPIAEESDEGSADDVPDSKQQQ